MSKNPYEKECLRCGRKWVARTLKRPVQCVRCKSIFWDEKRTEKK